MRVSDQRVQQLESNLSSGKELEGGNAQNVRLEPHVISRQFSVRTPTVAVGALVCNHLSIIANRFKVLHDDDAS